MTPSLSQDYIVGIDRQVADLARPGTWWTGAERVAIAAAARSAREHTWVSPSAAGSTLSSVASGAAARLSVERHADADWLEQLASEDISAEAYVELLSIVARFSAIDSLMFGIGADFAPLPLPSAGEPSRELVAAASINRGLVPTIGPASAPNALSAVSAETDMMLDLHGVLYLTIEQMGDLHIERCLSRAQMEFVAARTSYLNECFF